MTSDRSTVISASFAIARASRLSKRPSWDAGQTGADADYDVALSDAEDARPSNYRTAEPSKKTVIRPSLSEDIWGNMDLFHREIHNTVRAQQERRSALSNEEDMNEEEYARALAQHDEEEQRFWDSLESKEQALQNLVHNIQHLRKSRGSVVFPVRKSVNPTFGTAAFPRSFFSVRYSSCGYTSRAATA